MCNNFIFSQNHLKICVLLKKHNHDLMLLKYKIVQNLKAKLYLEMTFDLVKAR